MAEMTEAETAAANAAWRPARMTPDEIRQLAMDMTDGRVFFAKDERSLQSFMAMALIAPSLAPEAIEQIGLVYEYLDRAGERSMNGLPMFMSHKYVHVDDMPALRDKWEEFRAAKDAVLP